MRSMMDFSCAAAMPTGSAMSVSFGDGHAALGVVALHAALANSENGTPRGSV
jgi:hypothetical protein